MIGQIGGEGSTKDLDDKVEHEPDPKTISVNPAEVVHSTGGRPARRLNKRQRPAISAIEPSIMGGQIGAELLQFKLGDLSPRDFLQQLAHHVQILEDIAERSPSLHGLHDLLRKCHVLAKAFTMSP